MSFKIIKPQIDIYLVFDEIVRAMGRGQKPTARSIADVVGKKKTTVALVMRILVDEGLLERNGKNTKGSKLSITKKGTELWASRSMKQKNFSQQ